MIVLGLSLALSPLLGARSVRTAIGDADLSLYKPQEARASYEIGFLQGGYDIRPAHMDNARQLDRLKFNLVEVLCAEDFRLDSIVVVATASPEGTWSSNTVLSERRGNAMADYIRDYLSFGKSLPEIRISVKNVPENWEALDRLVREDANLSQEQKERYFSHSGMTDMDERERAMRGDSYYRYLTTELYPRLRVVELSFRGRGVAAPVLGVQHDTVFVYQRDTIYFTNPVLPEPEPENKLIMAFRTNILAVPLANVGIEVPIGNSWSVSTDVYYPWIWRDKYHKDCFEFWAMDLDVRYWFRGKKDSNPYHRLRGHSVGAYIAAGYYDFQREWFGYQGEFINAGLDYMYSVPAFKGRMRFQFELGIGYIYSPARVYDVFDEYGLLYRRRGTMQYTRWFGPTRAQVSIVIPIFADMNKKDKGGK